MHFRPFVFKHGLWDWQILIRLLWRCLTNTTLAEGDEKVLKDIKLTKTDLWCLYVLMLLTTTNLSCLSSVYIKKPRPFKNFSNLPNIYWAQSRTCMSQEHFMSRFFHDFVLPVKITFAKFGMLKDSKPVLFLDNV